jgi:oxygen-independent coproporphyrinogen-3 oxidase
MHVYLHVPFCARRCSYCDFAIAVRREVPSEAYVRAVLQEWADRQGDEAWTQAPSIETVYFGGGTPSRIPADAVAMVLERIAQDRTIAANAEITLEANPDDVNDSIATAWRSAGVNRISIGVQSFDSEVLRWMHRTHSADQVPLAVEALRRAGFGNISLDLIYGLPAELERDWLADLERALTLRPEHISLYGLSVEPRTPLAHWEERGEMGRLDDQRYAAEFLSAHDELGRCGYEHYEVSNWARPGYRSRHNSAYWQRRPFIGIGPAAHSGVGRQRRWNLREWAAYERALRSEESPVEGE